MNSTREFIQLAYETHCFYARILKEETIFIKNFLTPVNFKEVQVIDRINHQYETLLDELLELSGCSVCTETSACCDIVTPFTLKAELLFQYSTGIPIRTNIVKKEAIAIKKDSTITDAVEIISHINQKALLITSELVKLYKTILRSVFNQDTSWWLQQFIEEAACYIRILTKLEQHESADMEEIALWHRTMIYNSWFLYNIIEPSEIFLRQKVYKMGSELNRLTLDVGIPFEKEYIETIHNIIRELIEYQMVLLNGMLENGTKINIYPLLIDHLLRKSSHYDRLLNDISANDNDQLASASIWKGSDQAQTYPSEISTLAPLTITRWTSFHRITHFKPDEIPVINNIKMSANAEKIAISTYGGTYVINADGTNLIKLSDKRNEGLIDISADGSKIVWYDGYYEGYMAANGGGKTELTRTVKVYSVRMSADGEQIYVLAPEYKGGGIFRLTADEAELFKVVNTKDVAALGLADENANHWRGGTSGIDLSDDGSKLVFHFLWDGYAVNTNGSGLHLITKERTPDYFLTHIQINGNGNRIVRRYQGADDSILVFGNWEGGYTNIQKGKKMTPGNKIAECSTLQLTRDGSWAAMAWGYRIFSATDQSSLDVSDFGLAGDEPKPLNRISIVSLDATGKKACLMLDQGPQQLVIAELNPESLKDVPGLTNMAISPTVLFNDGSNNAIASAVPLADNLQYAGVSEFQDGWRIDAFGWPNAQLLDEGYNGDAKKGDGIFATSNLRISFYPPLSPGPLTSRFFAFTKDGNCIGIDVEGLSIEKTLINQ